jgi:RimJ/RimL family protein N-acetyltransferase
VRRQNHFHTNPHFCKVSLASFQPLVFRVENNSLLLRPVLRSDREALQKFAEGNAEALTGPFPITIAALLGRRSETASWLANKIENVQDRKGIFCVIEDTSSREIIGFVSAFQFEWRTPKCEISWMVSNHLQRKGVAHECCSYMVRYLFQEVGVNKILCRINPANEPSIQLATKLGFQKEGLHLRDFRDGNDNLLDVLYFGLLA